MIVHCYSLTEVAPERDGGARWMLAAPSRRCRHTGSAAVVRCPHETVRDAVTRSLPDPLTDEPTCRSATRTTSFLPSRHRDHARLVCPSPTCRLTCTRAACRSRKARPPATTRVPQTRWRHRRSRRRRAGPTPARPASHRATFIEICVFLPYPIKVWANGHEWAKRRATQAGIGFTVLSDGFASGVERPGAAARP
jgi:hypothetical protein